MRIQVTADACSGCRLCRQVCVIEKFGEVNPRRARLRIEARFPVPGKYIPHVCDQCGDCAEACPTEAIVKRDDGVYEVVPDLCSACGVCIDVCPEGVLVKGEDDIPFKCDFCWRCTEVCNTGALVRVA